MKQEPKPKRERNGENTSITEAPEGIGVKRIDKEGREDMDHGKGIPEDRKTKKEMGAETVVVAATTQKKETVGAIAKGGTMTTEMTTGNVDAGENHGKQTAEMIESADEGATTMKGMSGPPDGGVEAVPQEHLEVDASLATRYTSKTMISIQTDLDHIGFLNALSYRDCLLAHVSKPHGIVSCISQVSLPPFADAVTFAILTVHNDKLLPSGILACTDNDQTVFTDPPDCALWWFRRTKHGSF